MSTTDFGTVLASFLSCADGACAAARWRTGGRLMPESREDLLERQAPRLLATTTICCWLLLSTLTVSGCCTDGEAERRTRAKEDLLLSLGA